MAERRPVTLARGPVSLRKQHLFMTIPILVECYAGHRGEQTPRTIAIGDRRIDVAEILDAWLAPDHRYFKLSDREGDLWIVRHDVASDRWELAMFRSGEA